MIDDDHYYSHAVEPRNQGSTVVRPEVRWGDKVCEVVEERLAWCGVCARKGCIVQRSADFHVIMMEAELLQSL